MTFFFAGASALPMGILRWAGMVDVFLTGASTLAGIAGILTSAGEVAFFLAGASALEDPVGIWRWAGAVNVRLVGALTVEGRDHSVVQRGCGYGVLIIHLRPRGVVVSVQTCFTVVLELHFRQMNLQLPPSCDRRSGSWPQPRWHQTILPPGSDMRTFVYSLWPSCFVEITGRWTIAQSDGIVAAAISSRPDGDWTHRVANSTSGEATSDTNVDLFARETTASASCLILCWCVSGKCWLIGLIDGLTHRVMSVVTCHRIQMAHTRG